ncbi:MAG: concentrative nucleoside transporter, family [Bacteroidales bacterium]|jgi:CNT family concentrative nucleoside transporter|nr:concentrative nucleoside transporter, family [Bacteroidales bacterium]NLH51738.1 Na+ dependent nucleoside transporter [Bacteroidales bacterium]NPV35167.1 Na+ dependent nucleoside transporter [Bacteroidales bacterium]
MKISRNFLSVALLVLFLLVMFVPSALADTVVKASADSLAVQSAASAQQTLPELGGFNFNSLLRGIVGMAVLVVLTWLLSNNRKAVNWKVVATGLAIQVTLAVGVLYITPVRILFEVGGKVFVEILNFTKAGSEFILGGLLDSTKFGFIFAFQVLPTIIFFSALMSLLFYLGIIQIVVKGFAWVLARTLKISGPESLCAAGNIFLGQTEAPLMIKPYLPSMTRSEIFLVMTAGMATMAGGVLAAYISFLGGTDPVQRLIFAKHLLAASVMAAPGAVVISKILVPQTETVDRTVSVPRDKLGSNVLDAISNGTSEGLKLAANVAAMLVVFVAFIAMFNYILSDLVGNYTGLNAKIVAMTAGKYNGLTLQFLLGYLFAPLMWLIGVNFQDITLVGSLLGQKLILTEFVGYISLADYKVAGLFSDPKSIIISTYILCGFANFASIGIQIGGIGSLAPNQRSQLAAFGFRALIGGTIAALMSATIVGMITG